MQHRGQDMTSSKYSSETNAASHRHIRDTTHQEDRMSHERARGQQTEKTTIAIVTTFLYYQHYICVFVYVYSVEAVSWVLILARQTMPWFSSVIIAVIEKGAQICLIVTFFGFDVKKKLKKEEERQWGMKKRMSSHTGQLFFGKKVLTVAPWGQDCASVATVQRAAEWCHHYRAG